MPLPAISVVDGAARFLAEARVNSGVVQGKTLLMKKFELVDGESQDPGDVNGSDREGIVMDWNEEHVVVVK